MPSTAVQSAVGLVQSTDVALVFVSAFVIAYIYYNFVMHHEPKDTHESFKRQPPRLKSLPVIGSILYLPGLQQMRTFFLEKLPTMGPHALRSNPRVTTARVCGAIPAAVACIGCRHVIVLQTREAIVEAFAKVEFSDRAFHLFEEKRFKWAAKGITTLNYTAEFKKYHQLTLTILKEFGFGELSGVMESRIQDEVTDMIANFRASESQPTNPASVVKFNVMNVIASILFGRRFCIQNPQVQDFLSHNAEFTEMLTRTLPLMAVPALCCIPYFKRALNELERNLRWYNQVLQEKIVECENDETETPCFIRSFIEAEGWQNYDKIQLLSTLRDSVIAGTDTSAATVLWSLVLLANHQDIQARLQTEIDSIVSREKLPSLKDQSRLTFVEAFTLELMRIKTLVPWAVVHEVRKDTVVQGFHVPAKTIVIPSLYAVHMNPDVWEDPATFRPDRFIDKEGRIVNREKVIPFSVGKRSCLGEQLARQEIFLFVSGLLQNFTILPPEGCSTVECREIIGGFIVPSPYMVRFVPRKPKVEPV